MNSLTETLPKMGIPSMKRKIMMRESVMTEAEAMEKKEYLDCLFRSPAASTAMILVTREHSQIKVR